MIPAKTIDDILSAARVEEVIEDFVALKRRGVNMMGLCPFHDEKTPSFTVSPAKGIYKCFGCGKSGTSVGFIMEHEHLSYPEALKYLANKYNITVEEKEVSAEDRAVMQLTDALYIVNNFAAEHFTKNLLETDEGKAVGLSYFKERGFRQHTLDQWQLGFAMSSGKAFTSLALDKQYNLEHLQKLGLSTQYESDFFKSRVIFPIHNLSGKIVAFAGRMLSKDKNQPKYLNSPESEIYNKRKILYGFYFAKTAIRKADECIVVEGYTDVLTLYQGGVENVVASSGTSFTVDQIRLIKRFTDNIKIIYDGDPAGIKAALRGLDLVLAENMDVRLVLLPKDEDPDSFFKKSGQDAFTKYLDENAKDFIDFKTTLLLAEAGNDPIKRSHVLRDIVSSIALIPDAIKRAMYVKQTSSKMEIEEAILIAEVEKDLQKLKKEQQQQYHREKLREDRSNFVTEVIVNPEDGQVEMVPTTTLPKINDEHQERDLVRILITSCDLMLEKNGDVTVHEYLIPFVEENIDFLSNKAYKKIFEFAISKFKAGQKIAFKDFIHHEDADIRDTAVDLSISKYAFANWEEKGIFLQTQQMPEENFKKDCYESILRFRLRVLKKEINELEKMILENTDEDKMIDIKVLQQLLNERNEIAKELTQIVL